MNPSIHQCVRNAPHSWAMQHRSSMTDSIVVAKKLYDAIPSWIDSSLLNSEARYRFRAVKKYSAPKTEPRTVPRSTWSSSLKEKHSRRLFFGMCYTMVFALSMRRTQHCKDDPIVRLLERSHRRFRNEYPVESNFHARVYKNLNFVLVPGSAISLGRE